MKIMFGGDLVPTIRTEQSFINENVSKLFNDALYIFSNNDFNIVNLECALTESNKEITKYGPCLKASPKVVKGLKKLNVTHCLLSNNHVFDYGKQGLYDTINALKGANIGYTGIGENKLDARRDLILEKEGETLAVINVSEHEYSYALEDRVGCREFDVFKTLEDIRLAKSKNNRVAVIYHGGKEQSEYPSPRLVEACRAMARAGADIILCQHSHCIGCYEFYENTHILYGQGNFNFVKPELDSLYGWKQGIAVHYDSKNNKVEFTYCNQLDDGVELLKGEKLKEANDAFNLRNERLKDGSYLKYWHEYCLTVAGNYIKYTKEYLENMVGLDTYHHVLGHYLDCEAHHDVLVEIFKTANHTNEKD